jgi:hypothetical protein
MFGVGLVYYAYMLIRGKSLTMPGAVIEPEEAAPLTTKEEDQRVA